MREVEALLLGSGEQRKEDRVRVDDFVEYLTGCLLKEGYYFSYDYELSLSR